MESLLVVPIQQQPKTVACRRPENCSDVRRLLALSRFTRWHWRRLSAVDRAAMISLKRASTLSELAGLNPLTIDSSLVDVRIFVAKQRATEQEARICCSAVCQSSLIDSSYRSGRIICY